MSIAPRRRVLCLRPRPNESAAPILTAVTDEWVEALALHADVKSITADFDLQQACEAHRPDLIVVDALHWGRPWALGIANPRARPDIPRILFLNSDPHDPFRVMTMRMAAELGVEAVFFGNEAYRQHMPELRHVPHYLAPMFIDDEVFRDYGLEKTVPVSVFGGHLMPSFYPWRARLLEQVQHVFPTLIYTHPGYTKEENVPFLVQGETYARLLNQSWFSAADTTRLDYAVRKHMEIPASGAVLIAPDSDALAGYGFVDMENCLLGEGQELFAKMNRLARNPADYQRVREAGVALVHSRYTRRHWRGMLDWLECRLRLKPGQMIQQVGRYGPFRGLAPGPSTPSILASMHRDSDMASALRAARDAILTGQNLREGVEELNRAGLWSPMIAEPYFLISILALLHGETTKAATGIGRRAQGQATIDESVATLDPVEVAWLLLIARLLDNAQLEAAVREQAVGMNHVALRRMLWLLEGCPAGEGLDEMLLARQAGDLPSVHWLGEEDFTQWCDLLRRVLLANRASPGFSAISGLLAAA